MHCNRCSERSGVGAVTGAVSGAATSAVKHRVTTGSWKGSGVAALDGAASGALSGAITGAKIDTVEAEASVTANVVEFEISSRGVNVYSTLKTDVGINAGGFKLSSEQYFINDLKTNTLVRSDETPISDLKFTTNKTFGGKFYFIVGFTFEVEIDTDSIIECIMMMG